MTLANKADIISAYGHGWAVVMGAFDTQVPRMRSGAQACAQTADEIEQARSSFEGQAASVVGGSWRGPAAEDFRRGLEQWDQGAREVIHSLRTLGELVENAARGYAATDTSSASGLRESGSGLGRSRLNI